MALVIRQRFMAFILFLSIANLNGKRSIPTWLIERMSTNLTERNFFLHRTLVGVTKGIQECKAQFHWERWNCDVPDKPISTLITLGEYFPRATKETAFLNAIVSSSITLSVAVGCSIGGVDLCWRPGSKKSLATSPMHHHERCQEILDIGRWISEYFTDYIEQAWNKNPKRLIVNKHNNNIGRKVVQKLLKTKCACCGPSGSCTQKMCVQTLPHLSEVGKTLHKMYGSSKQVIVADNGTRINHSMQKDTRHLTNALVFSHASPNYCRRNLTQGSKGTLGRICMKSRGVSDEKNTADHCLRLCTSCGHKVLQKRKLRKCACKFYWCCHVRCKHCRRKIKLKYCG